MKRITPEAIKEAMERTGLKLIHNDWGDGITCGCPQTILYADQCEGHKLTKEYTEDDSFVEDWADAGFDGYYAMGFRVGFDEPERSINFSNGYGIEDSYRQGVTDGKECRMALLKEEEDDY
jgi:hypothetical protein